MKKNKFLLSAITLTVFFLLSGCSSIPDNVRNRKALDYLDSNAGNFIFINAENNKALLNILFNSKEDGQMQVLSERTKRLYASILKTKDKSSLKAVLIGDFPRFAIEFALDRNTAFKKNQEIYEYVSEHIFFVCLNDTTIFVSSDPIDINYFALVQSNPNLPINEKIDADFFFYSENPLTLINDPNESEDSQSNLHINSFTLSAKHEKESYGLELHVSLENEYYAKIFSSPVRFLIKEIVSLFYVENPSIIKAGLEFSTESSGISSFIFEDGLKNIAELLLR